jgi:hypothetical protein
MEDPVIADDGHSYERTAIQNWMKDRMISPVTDQLLTNKTLRPNHELKTRILFYCRLREVGKNWISGIQKSNLTLCRYGSHPSCPILLHRNLQRTTLKALYHCIAQEEARPMEDIKLLEPRFRTLQSVDQDLLLCNLGLDTKGTVVYELAPKNQE